MSRRGKAGFRVKNRQPEERGPDYRSPVASIMREDMKNERGCMLSVEKRLLGGKRG